ncbi:MAG: PcfK-like family protein [Bacteroides xylanisolvens]
MKTNNNSFQDTIKAYLDKRAEEDPLFAITYAKENKSLDECISYIMGEALKSSTNIKSGVKGCRMDNDSVYSLAVHYYDEDDIKVSKLPTNVKSVASNSAPKKPEEKKAEAPTPILRIKPKKKEKEDVGQYSLF